MTAQPTNFWLAATITCCRSSAAAAIGKPSSGIRRSGNCAVIGMPASRSTGLPSGCSESSLDARTDSVQVVVFFERVGFHSEYRALDWTAGVSSSYCIDQRTNNNANGMTLRSGSSGWPGFDPGPDRASGASLPREERPRQRIR